MAGVASIVALVGLVAASTGTAAAAGRFATTSTPSPSDSVTPTPSGTPTPTPTPSVTPTPTPKPLVVHPTVVTVIGAARGGTRGGVVVHVLANDRDPNGGKLHVVSVSQPRNGSAVIVNNLILVHITTGWGKVTLNYNVSSSSGVSAKSSVNLTVLPPPIDVHMSLVQNGQTRGIGTLLTLHFSQPIQYRNVVQSHLQLTSTKNFGVGAWAWRDATTLEFRPRDFWPGHSTITVHSTLSNVIIGWTADHHPYMGLNTTASFKTTRAVISRINAITDQMTVTIDGKLARTMGVSLGKPGYTTRSGIKVVAEKYVTRRMTSQAIGVTNPADQFDVVAPWAVRITTSGEFIHGAPWALYRIGKWNGSHGCTNLTPWDAHWFYNLATPGDVVLTTGTNRPMEDWNGEGGPWNIPWKAWVAMSAGPLVTWSPA